MQRRKFYENLKFQIKTKKKNHQTNRILLIISDIFMISLIIIKNCKINDMVIWTDWLLFMI